MNVDALLQKAQKLIEAVEFDVNGYKGRGGHGGLISNVTLRAAGILRAEIHKVKREG